MARQLHREGVCVGRTPPSTASDASGGHLPQAPDIPAASGALGLPLSATGSGRGAVGRLFLYLVLGHVLLFGVDEAPKSSSGRIFRKFPEVGLGHNPGYQNVVQVGVCAQIQSLWRSSSSHAVQSGLSPPCRDKPHGDDVSSYGGSIRGHKPPTCPKWRQA